MMALCCAGFALLLVCGTIVLSLIPLYLEQKSVTRNIESTRSNRISMTLQTDISAEARRKRQDGSQNYGLKDCIGCTFSNDSTEQLKGNVETMFKQGSSKVDKITDMTVTVGTTESNARRRRKLSRRATKKVTLIVSLVFQYSQSCDTACQNKESTKIQTNIETKKTTVAFTLTNVKLLDQSGTLKVTM